MLKTPIKVAITGAAGQIGYALLFRIANGDMFGKDQAVALQLLELPVVLPTLQGVIMELEDCAFPLLKNVIATDDANVAMKDANWAMLAGSASLKAGMERLDLLQFNAGIFSKQGCAINDNAASDIRVLVVANPCNTACLIAMRNAPDVPHDRFYAMTLLDENRARTQLAKKAKVNVDAVQNLIVWGNHSGTQYPDFYHATIAGQPVTNVITDYHWLEHDFIPVVQKRGIEIIKARGGTSSVASAANAAIGTVYHLVHDTSKGQSYSVASCSEGEYDVDQGLIFSFPSHTVNGKHQIIQGISHNDFGKQMIETTLDELRKEFERVIKGW